MRVVPLTPIERHETLPILVQGSAAPVFRGTHADGESYLCGVCQSQTLAEAVAEGDFFDVAFRCNACDGLSMGPRLPPGRPLPWSHTVVLDPREYMIRGTIEGREGVVMAGREAVDRALREVGATTPFEVDGSGELNAALLDAMAARAKALLGDAYAELRESHNRGLRSRTPPRIPHRLIQLIDAADAAAQSFRDGTPEIDPVAVVELHVTVEQLDRWKNHPVWPSLLPSLKSPQDFPHVVVTVTAATFLTLAGNAVELVAVAHERRPDLRLHLTARETVGTEVKAPLALQRPHTPVDAAGAMAIVQKALKRAGSGAGGQLSSDADALLVIGAFGIRESDLDALEEAATLVLQSYPEERTHVLGIAILSLGVLLDSRQVGIARREPMLSGTVGTRMIENASYAGLNRVSREERPGLSGRSIDVPLREVELGARGTARN